MSSSLDYQIWLQHQSNANASNQDKPYTQPPTKEEAQGMIYLLFLSFFFMAYYYIYKSVLDEKYIIYAASVSMLPTIYIYLKYKTKIDNIISFTFGSFILLGIGSWIYDLIA